MKVLLKNVIAVPKQSHTCIFYILFILYIMFQKILFSLKLMKRFMRELNIYKFKTTAPK